MSHELDLTDHSEKIYAHRRYFYLLWFQRGWIAAILPSAFYFYEPVWLIAGGSWLVLSGVYCWMMVRKRYFQFNQSQLIIGKGAINTVWQQAELSEAILSFTIITCSIFHFQFNLFYYLD